MMSDLSNYQRQYSPDGLYFLFQFEGFDVISVLKNAIEYSFELLKCLLKMANQGFQIYSDTDSSESSSSRQLIETTF